VFAPVPFAQERGFGQPHGQHQVHRVCYIYSVGGVALFNVTASVGAPPPNNSVKRTPVNRFRSSKRCGRRRLPQALGVQEESLYLVSYDAEPLPSSASFASCSGAAVNVWVSSPTEQEALVVASREVQKAGWRITTPGRIRRTVRTDYADAPEGLPYFEQALLDGSVVVFHTWQEGVRH
jgi:hypothetical protein